MKNLKIGARLGVGFATVLFLLATLTVIGIWRLQTASELTDMLVNVRVKNERLLTEWDKIIVVNNARTLAAFRVTDLTAQKEFEQLIMDSSSKAVEIQKQLESSIKDPHAKELFLQSLDKRKVYQDSRREVFRLKAVGNKRLPVDYSVNI